MALGWIGSIKPLRLVCINMYAFYWLGGPWESCQKMCLNLHWHSPRLNSIGVGNGWRDGEGRPPVSGGKSILCIVEITKVFQQKGDSRRAERTVYCQASVHYVAPHLAHVVSSFSAQENVWQINGKRSTSSVTYLYAQCFHDSEVWFFILFEQEWGFKMNVPSLTLNCCWLIRANNYNLMFLFLFKKISLRMNTVLTVRQWNVCIKIWYYQSCKRSAAVGINLPLVVV